MTAPAFQAAGTEQHGVSTANLTVPWPTHQANDIALLLVETTGGQAATMFTANGFVSLGAVSTGVTTAGTRLSVWWCRATSSAMASPVVQIGANHGYAVILTFRGVSQTVDVATVVSTSGVKAAASTSASTPSISTATDDTLVVGVITRDDDSAAAEFSAWADSSLTSVTEVWDSGTTDGNGGGIGVATGVKALASSNGGFTNGFTATVVSSINVSLAFALPPDTSFTVAVATAFGFSLTAAAEEDLTGTVAIAFGFSPAAVAEQDFTLSDTSTFGWAPAAALQEASNVVAGAIEFGWSEAAAAEQDFVATVSPAFGFAPSATLTYTPVPITGTVAITFGWSDSAAVAEVFTATAGPSFGWSAAITATEIHSTDETGIGVRIYTPSGASAAAGEFLENALASWTDPWLDVGSGKFTIPSLDAKATAANLAADNIVGMTLNDVLRYAFFIENDNRILASPAGPSAETWTVGGRGMEAYLERSIIYPYAWPTDTKRDLALTRTDIVSNALIYAEALAAAAIAGATNLKVTSVAGVTVGMFIQVGDRIATYEICRVTAVGTAGSGGTGLTIETDGSGLAFAHASNEEVNAVEGSRVSTTYGAGTSTLTLTPDVDSFRPGDEVTFGASGVSVERAVIDVIDYTAKTIHLTTPLVGPVFTNDWVIGTQLLSGRRPFTGPPGQIMADVLAESIALGELPLLDVTFDGSLDTNGHAWGDDVIVDFSVGTNLLDIWKKLVALGMYSDLRFTGTAIAAHAWYDDPGADQTAYVVIRQGAQIRDAVNDQRQQPAWKSRVLVEGANSTYLEVIGGTETSDNRRTGFVSFGSTDDTVTLETVGDETLAEANVVQQAIKVPVHHGTANSKPRQYNPYFDYTRGDTIALDIPGVYSQEAFRTQAITVESGGDYAGQWLVTLDLNSVALDATLRLKKLLDALASTTTNVTTSSVGTATVTRDAIADNSVTAEKLQQSDDFTMRSLLITDQSSNGGLRMIFTLGGVSGNPEIQVTAILNADNEVTFAPQAPVQALYGLTIPTSAGSPSGGYVGESGSIDIDTTNHRLYWYENSAWHYVSRTAGITIPSDADGVDETVCPNCNRRIVLGERIVARVNATFSDGALHGLWEHLKCPSNRSATRRTRSAADAGSASPVTTNGKSRVTRKRSGPNGQPT